MPVDLPPQPLHPTVLEAAASAGIDPESVTHAVQVEEILKVDKSFDPTTGETRDVEIWVRELHLTYVAKSSSGGVRVHTAVLPWR